MTNADELLDDAAPTTTSQYQQRPKPLWWLTFMGLANLWAGHLYPRSNDWAIIRSLNAFLLLPFLFWGMYILLKQRPVRGVGYLLLWGVFMAIIQGAFVPAEFYHTAPYTMCMMVALLAIIDLQQDYTPHPTLWQGLHTLVLAYLVTWFLALGFVWFGVEDWYWTFVIVFGPLGVALVFIVSKNWSLLLALPWSIRLLWMGGWGLPCVLWTSTGGYWIYEVTSWMPSTPLVLFDLLEQAEIYAELVHLLASFGFAALGAMAGRQVFDNYTANR